MKKSLNERKSLPPQCPIWAACATGMTSEVGWQDLLRRSPDLAEEYHRELRHERLRKMARRTRAISSLAACIFITIAVGLWYGSKKRGGLTAYIEASKHSNLSTQIQSNQLDDTLALELPDTAAEAVPNFRSVDYVLWLDRNASWFAERFPSSIDDRDQQADYISRLARSGDLFQFPSATAENQTLMSLPLVATERCSSIVGSKAIAPMPSVAKDPIVRWMNAAASAEQAGPAEQTRLLLFSLQAGRYFVKTREAAALWAIRHGNEATALIMQGDANPAVHGVALPPEGYTAIDLPQFFERQAFVASQIVRSAENLLAGSPDARCLSISENDWRNLQNDVNRLHENPRLP